MIFSLSGNKDGIVWQRSGEESRLLKTEVIGCRCASSAEKEASHAPSHTQALSETQILTATAE